MGEQVSVFGELNQINVNGHTENKNGLTYLSWAWAWTETKKRFPDASYKIWKDDSNRPYVYDENLGYMVFTSVTINGETIEMWLPVMDAHNFAMKSTSYVVKKQIKGQIKEFTIDAATMFDINKTIMRCLVKNLAMFGLGLYIFAGEDLPDSIDGSQVQTAKPERLEVKKAQVNLLDKADKFIKENNIPEKWLCGFYSKNALVELTEAELNNILGHTATVLASWNKEQK